MESVIGPPPPITPVDLGGVDTSGVVTLVPASDLMAVGSEHHHHQQHPMMSKVLVENVSHHHHHHHQPTLVYTDAVLNGAGLIGGDKAAMSQTGPGNVCKVRC